MSKVRERGADDSLVCRRLPPPPSEISLDITRLEPVQFQDLRLGKEAKAIQTTTISLLKTDGFTPDEAQLKSEQVFSWAAGWVNAFGVPEELGIPWLAEEGVKVASSELLEYLPGFLALAPDQFDLERWIKSTCSYLNPFILKDGLRWFELWKDQVNHQTLESAILQIMPYESEFGTVYLGLNVDKLIASIKNQKILRKLLRFTIQENQLPQLLSRITPKQVERLVGKKIFDASKFPISLSIPSITPARQLICWSEDDETPITHHQSTWARISQSPSSATRKIIYHHQGKAILQVSGSPNRSQDQSCFLTGLVNATTENGVLGIIEGGIYVVSQKETARIIQAYQASKDQVALDILQEGLRLIPIAYSP